MIVVIDNFDSFTYNLVQYIGELGQDIRVFRNNAISVDELRALRPAKIVISPGPGRPTDSGVSMDVIRELGPTIPILGVCLGHQAIGECFGADVVHAPSIMHGKTSPVIHDGLGVFSDIPSPFTATRYHSLVIAPGSLPDSLVKTAWTEDGVIMGVRHRDYPIEGIQFHPESILTEHGKQIVANFIKS
ncbi:MAG: aminodeoxychorismate/anthranilate synthase component II [bacterium]|nr:aminodeoxychorismate/anthranilate synthase component II [bacterium]